MDRNDIDAIYPLSPIQQGILFHSTLAGAGDPYLGQIGLMLIGPLDRSLFERSWQTIVDRHPILRTVFTTERRGKPLQVVMKTMPIVMRHLDWRELDDATQQERMVELLTADREEGIDPTRGPLMRLTLVRLAEERHRLVWTEHHLLLDGWSVPIVLDELSRIYASLCADAGRAVAGAAAGAALPPAPPYRRYIDWLSKQDRGEAEAYWRRLLAGVHGPTRLVLERDSSAGASSADGASVAQSSRQSAATIGTDEHAVRVAHIEADQVRRLRALARAHRVTLNVVVQAAWALLLARCSGETDIVYGQTTSGRPADLDDVARIVGPFINTLPMRVRIGPGLTMRELFRGLQAQQADSQRYEYTPLVDIQRWTEVAPGDALIDSLFVFENYPERQEPPADGPGVGRLAMTEITASEQTSFPLALLVGAGERMVLKALHATARFDAHGIDTLLRRLTTILEQFARQLPADETLCDMRLADVDLLTPHETRRLLVEWNDTATGYPRDAGVAELFEEQARLSPAAVALECGGRTMTYAALDHAADRLARRLRAMGVDSEQVVGLCVERGARMVVALLAILKAGGAYLPLDASHPRARIELMLAECGARLVLVDGQTAPFFDGIGVTCVRLDLDESDASETEAGEDDSVEAGVAGTDLVNATGQAGAAPSGKARPRRPGTTGRQLAYVMYTSGSTGAPKGVAIEQRSIVRLVRDTRYVRFSANEVLFQFAPLAFDASTFEIWGSLLNGARLVIAPAGMPSLAELGEAIARSGVTLLWLTAGLFHRMVDAQAPALRGVRQLIAGGEPLSVPVVRRALAALPETTLVNGYGPTEGCTFTCCHTLSIEEADAPSIAIGRPIANTQVYILDADLRLTPPGTPGDLYAAGDGLARGYRHRPDLTAERFVPHPFATEPGARLYRTGDRARYRAVGCVEFLGRRDRQVKVRGFRIELEEIEAVLARHPAVRQSAVALRDTESGDTQIVAALVLHPGQGDRIVDTVRELARTQLPAYMVPGRIVCLDSLPLTTNGKVDRHAVAAACVESASEPSAAAAITSPVEEVLAGLWRELFQLPVVHADDDFFALGGHSLTAMQAVSCIRDLFPVDLPLRAIFECQTLRALAAEIEQRLRSGPHARVPIRPAVRAGALPLSLAQQRLWFLDRLEPGNPFYNIHLAFRLRGPLDIGALERSLQDLGHRHESLRTTFPDVEGEPTQRVAPVPSFALERVDVGGDEASLGEGVTRVAHQPFMLSEGPLFRPVLFRRGVQEHVLLLVMHHIISDGRSVSVLLEELSQRYRAHTGGADRALPPLAIQYADYAVWEREWLEGADMARQTTFWQACLQDAPQLTSFAGATPRPARRAQRGETWSWPLASAIAAPLDVLARREGATRFMVLLAALYVLLRHHTGQDDLIVGADVANRNQPELPHIVGFFVNQLALRTSLAGDPSFRALLTRVRETALSAYAHDELPFQNVIDAAGAERRMNQAPLFQTKLLYQRGGPATIAFDGVDVEPFRVALESSAFDLVLAVLETDDGLLATIEFDTDLFGRAAIERLAAEFDDVLGSAVAAPETSVSQLCARLAALSARRQQDERRGREAASLGLLRGVKPVPLGL